MKPPPARLFAAAIVLLALSGCYPDGRPQPASVPPDFPVYSAADPTNEVYGWASPLPDGSKDRREHFDITWTRSSNGHGGTIAFSRSSKPAWGGTIYLADHKIHVIMGQDCPCGVPS